MITQTVKAANYLTYYWEDESIELQTMYSEFRYCKRVRESILTDLGRS